MFIEGDVSLKSIVVLIGISAILILIAGSLSGCIHNPPSNNDNGDTNKVEYITVSELKLHPNQYLGNNTTLKAIFEGRNDYDKEVYYHVLSDEALDYEAKWIGIEIPDNVNTDLLMLGETYYFTGIPGYGDYTAYDDEMGEPNSGLYLKVSSIDLVYTDNSKIVILKHVGDHPPSYLGKSITVKAKAVSGLKQITYTDKEGDCSWCYYTTTLNINTTNVDTSLLIPEGEYYFTGVLKIEGLHPYIPSYTSYYWDQIYTRKLTDMELVIEKIEAV